MPSDSTTLGRMRFAQTRRTLTAGHAGHAGQIAPNPFALLPSALAPILRHPTFSKVNFQGADGFDTSMIVVQPSVGKILIELIW